MMSNPIGNLKVATFCLLLCTSLAGVRASLPISRKLHDNVCRAEEVCLNQACDPAAYKYDLEKDGKDFPYSISYTFTADQRQTRHIFAVCATQDAVSACKSGSSGCFALSSVKIRMRNDMLSLGRDLLTNPAGKMWASCSPNGPGHLWEAEDLGVLGSEPPKNASCTNLEVLANSDLGGKTAQLRDICQQNVTIVDNEGGIVLDQSTTPSSCLFVLEGSNGRVGYILVSDKTSISSAQDIAQSAQGIASSASSPSEDALAKGPAAYGRIVSYGKRRRALSKQLPRRLL